MKIICTVTNDLNSDQRMIRTCHTLHQLGHEVWLIGRQKKDSKPLQKRPYFQYRMPCIAQKGKWFYLEYNLRLWWFLARAKAEVICSVDLDTAMPARFWRVFKSWRWVIDAHEWFPFVPEVERRPVIQKIWLWVERQCIPRADAVYTVGEAIAQGLESQYLRTVKVVRNAPMLEIVGGMKELPRELTLPEKPFLLYQGALNEGRGLERLLEILIPTDIDLVLVGTGDIESKLKEQVKRMHLESRVHFLGFVEPQYLAAITQRAHVGYNVSEAVSKSYELSLNNKFFDYVHALLPSVINDFIEYRSLCKKFNVGILVPNDNQYILEAIKRLFQDEVFHEACRSECRKAREMWHWQRESEELQVIFESN